MDTGKFPLLNFSIIKMSVFHVEFRIFFSVRQHVAKVFELVKQFVCECSHRIVTKDKFDDAVNKSIQIIVSICVNRNNLRLKHACAASSAFNRNGK